MVQVHDFGEVISDDQVLEHAFTLKNPTDQPLPLAPPIALTPCCSSIQLESHLVPPQGEVQAVILLNTRGQDGQGRVDFQVHTLGTPQIVWKLSALSTLLPAWQVQRNSLERIRLEYGEGGTYSLQVACRRWKQGGLSLPTQVEGPKSVVARFDGQPTRTIQGEIITETHRLDFRVLPSSIIGPQNATLSFTWPDGSKREHEIHWTVEPAVEVLPSALVVQQVPIDSASELDEKELVVRCKDRPIKILEIRGPGVSMANPSTQPPNLHRIRVALSRRLALSQKVSYLHIFTDHPAQAEIRIAVLGVNPAGGSDAPK